MLSKEQLKLGIHQAAKIRELSSSNKTNTSNNTSLPSTPQLVRNVTDSVIKNIQSVVSGNPLNVTEDEKTRRLNICKECPYFLKEQERCSKCGCYMAVKTYLKAEKCPEGKW